MPYFHEVTLNSKFGDDLLHSALRIHQRHWNVLEERLTHTRARMPYDKNKNNVVGFSFCLWFRLESISSMYISIKFNMNITIAFVHKQIASVNDSWLVIFPFLCDLPYI